MKNFTSSISSFLVLCLLSSLALVAGFAADRLSDRENGSQSDEVIAVVQSEDGATSLADRVTDPQPEAVPPDPAPPVPEKGALPLPHTMSSPDYQRLLYPYIASRSYRAAGWGVDKGIRDTGPFIDGSSYGTHNAVRIYYSPEIVAWLKRGRKGGIPDGAMIVKEMFSPPAARYATSDSAAIDSALSGWAIMVRDSSASKDGWYWSYYGPGQKVDDPSAYPYDYPNSTFGAYCVRCHASAEGEFTFSATKNLKGFPGDPLIFRVDNSWIPSQSYQIDPHQLPSHPIDTPTSGGHGKLASDIAPGEGGSGRTPGANPLFLKTFPQIDEQNASDIQLIPSVAFDHVIAGAAGPGQFLTSDQCLSCHDGQGLPFGPNMYIPSPTGANVNLSPYGEWNWSMMGLAGRDPIFYSQIESEVRLYPERAGMIQDLCFRCHGVMGDRQLHIDQPGKEFTREIPFISDESDPLFRYGALARDGVSCTVCHQIVDDKLPLDSIVTGQFRVSHPGQFEKGMSQIYGPFDKPATMPMRESLGMTPVKSDYITSSRLCGSCHAVLLPVFDTLGVQVGSTFEQSTYLEWLNSDFQNEMGEGGKSPKTCQNCHMPTTYPFLPDDYSGTGIAQKLAFRIANIQDQTYPDVEHKAPLDSMHVDIRPDFARHTLLGINLFGLEMFRQFDRILGVRTQDFMTYSKNGLPFAIQEGTNLAQNHTARVSVVRAEKKKGALEVDIHVTNLTGHRFPSGVGFRRAWLELQVVDEKGRTLWASGGSNDVGVIVDGNGKPLPSEFFDRDPRTGRQSYQQHYQEITGEDQVQIYQELVRDSRGDFTTSFLGIVSHVKDNRLLPKGWTPEGPTGFEYAEETRPVGRALQDANFLDGTGSDQLSYRIDLSQLHLRGSSPDRNLKPARVVAILHYQSIPPYYLNQRFTIAPNGRGTERLHFMASHLQTAGTPVEGWKIFVAQGESAIRE